MIADTVFATKDTKVTKGFLIAKTANGELDAAFVSFVAKPSSCPSCSSWCAC